MNQDRHKRKLTAILSADVVGYSRLMEEDEAWAIKNIEENKSLISALIKDYHGRVVDAPGDNILAEFSSITNAVECAVKIQQELKKKNANIVENRRMEFRIGINLGEVFEEEDRIYGSGVNIAARIEGLSEAGGICISGRTYDHVKKLLDLGYEFLGEHNVKNISEPIRAYRVLTDLGSTGKIIREKRAAGIFPTKTVMCTIICIIIIVIGLLIWRFYPNQTISTEEVPVQQEVKEAPKTIAVLPFDDYSTEKDQEQFVLGLSEEILNSLTQIPDLLVTGRTSSFSFKGSTKKIQEIANELGVEYILEGSVRKSSNELRITAQLLQGSDGFHLWSETYDRELKDIFDIQEDIANNVADKLKLTLEAFGILGGTKNIEAYEHFLIAKGQMSDIFETEIGEDTITKTRRAQESLDAAIALDPGFALAWTFKTIIHWYHLTFKPNYHFNSDQDPGLLAANRAIELEPNLAEGYYSLGLSRFLRSEYVEAELAYRKAMELSSDPMDSYQFGFPVFSLMVGSFKRANEIIKTCRQIDPLNETIYGVSVLASSLLGDVQTAEEEYKSGKEIIGGLWELGDSYITTLRLSVKKDISRNDIVYYDSIFDTAKKHLHTPKEGLKELRQIYSSDGNLGSVQLLFMACWAAYFGDIEFAMGAIEKAYSIDASMLYLNWFPVVKEVRQLPRFKEFVREIGLVDYWKEYGWPDTGICRPIDDDDDFECE